MLTINSISVSADPGLVFRTASNVLDWPRILPHYRWVRRVGALGEGEIFEMAARRSWIPVRWVALTRLNPATRQIHFTHVGGLTRGMEVVWSIDPAPGGAAINIVHDLTSLKVPIVQSAPGRFITGRVFVDHIARQTLRHMKRWIEEQCVAQSSPV